MNSRKGLVYLAGAIDLAPDRGLSWRSEIQQILKDYGLHCFDPASYEVRSGLPSPEALSRMRQVRRPEFVRYVRKQIERDLSIIRSRAGCVVAKLDKNVRAGTYGELVYAYALGLPIFVITDDESTLPNWIIACAEQIFTSAVECAATLVSMQERFAHR